MTVLLQARSLSAGYGQVEVIRDIDLEVRGGEVVALLGANGAGKTTTLLTLAGVLPPDAGEVRWLERADRRPLHRRAREGLAYVSEERSVFQRLTARQNLAITRGGDIRRAISAFPELEPLLHRRGGLLSGGEQQILSLARALSRPTRLLMADELSLGLAPRVVGRLLRAVRAAADDGMEVLLVEQHVHRVLEIADRVYVLRNGRIEYSGSAEEARLRIDEIRRHYLSSATTAGAPR